MAKIAVVIGCSGQDGLLQTRLLVKYGYFVIGICRDKQRFNSLLKAVTDDINNIHTIEHDFKDFNTLTGVLQPYDIDEIYNFAGVSSIAASWSNPYDTVRLNTLFLVSLLEYVRRETPASKIFQAGSSECFIRSGLDEDERFVATSPYSLSKLASFSLVNLYRKSFGLFCVNGILFNHESIFRREGFVSRKIVQGIKQISQDQKSCLFLGNLDSVRDWGDAEDFVRGFHQVLQKSKSGNYVFRSGNIASVREVVEFCALNVGHDLVWKGTGIDEVGVLRNSGRIVVRISSEFFRPLDTDSEALGDFGAVEENPWVPSVDFEQLFSKLMKYDFIM